MGGVFKFRAMSSAAQTPIVVDNSAEIAKQQAEEERKKALERQRRGWEGNVRTSYNGLLGEKENNLQRKKLLGE